MHLVQVHIHVVLYHVRDMVLLLVIFLLMSFTLKFFVFLSVRFAWEKLLPVIAKKKFIKTWIHVKVPSSQCGPLKFSYKFGITNA